VPNFVWANFPADAEAIKARLRQPPTLFEFFALFLALGMLGVFAWYHALAGEIHPLDYGRYLRVANGDFSIHYYAYWSVPLFSVLPYFPGLTGYLLWGVLSILAIFVAARIFGGHAASAILTYQLFYILFYGQIMALLVGGLALCRWGLVNRRWHWAGLGLVIATTKYQTGLSFGLFLWLLADLSWRNRLKVLIVPLCISSLFLIIYPLWPLTSVATILNNPPDAIGSITLWRWLGPSVLCFWLPPLLLPLVAPATGGKPPALSRQDRFLALSATSAFALPYFQQTDLIFLFVLPVFSPGWQLLLGNLGYLLFTWKQWPGLWVLVLIPLLLYARIILPALYKLRHRLFA